MSYFAQKAAEIRSERHQEALRAPKGKEGINTTEKKAAPLSTPKERLSSIERWLDNNEPSHTEWSRGAQAYVALKEQIQAEERGAWHYLSLPGDTYQGCVIFPADSKIPQINGKWQRLEDGTIEARVSLFELRVMREMARITGIIEQPTNQTITESGYKITHEKKQGFSLLYHFIVSGEEIGQRYVDIRHVAKAAAVGLDSIAACVGCDAEHELNPDYTKLCEQHRREALSLLLNKLDDSKSWLNEQEKKPISA